jgi:transposase
MYESTRARIKYGSGEVEIDGVEAEFRSGYSTSLGRIRIESTAEHHRRTSFHFREWAVFGAFYAIPTVIPFFLWLATRSVSKRIAKHIVKIN